ncbi:MAG: DUF4139 domain-containing protein [Anaerohalosphaeraceae bacterium]
MKSHLTQDMLIQYQFDLLDNVHRQEASAHLNECGPCRQLLEGVRRQFSALDALNADATLQDELIQKTLASIRQAKPLPTVTSWAGLKWMAPAAVILLAAGVLFVVQSYWQDSAQKIQDKSVTHSLTQPAIPMAPEPIATKTESVASIGLPATARIIPQEEIPDKAPFAPASAIELVVLPKPDQMQMTIYNSADLTLVRDTRKLTLKAGWNWLQFMWAETMIDPTSLSLRPLEYADKIDVQQLVYPARLQDIGRWLIRSEVEGSVPFEITYFISGLSWRAFYEGLISPDEKTMQLRNYVRIQNNSGQDYENVQTRLIIGQVHLLDQISILAGRQYPYGPEAELGELEGLNRGSKLRGLHDKDGQEKHDWYFGLELNGPMGGLGGGRMAGGAVFYDYKDIAKEGLSEYFLYTIEGTEDLPNEWAKRLPSQDVSDIPIKSLYKYDEDRYGTQTMRFVSFANDSEHKLGTTPLPNGTMKLYRQVNDEQNTSYVGGADIKYIPVNEEAELNLGTDALVKVEPTLMDSRTENYLFNDKGDIAGWDEIETWQIKLTNTRDIPADFEVTRNFNTDSWDLIFSDDLSTDQSKIEYVKHDAQHGRFTAHVQARTTRCFEYILTKRAGTRKEQRASELQETASPQMQSVLTGTMLSANLDGDSAPVLEMTEQDKDLMARLEQKVNLNLKEEMAFIDCINTISQATSPHLPILIASKDLSENAFFGVRSEITLKPDEYSDIPFASAMTKILESASENSSTSIKYAIHDGVIWIVSSDFMYKFWFSPSINVTSLMNMSENSNLNNQLKQPVTLNLFREGMTFGEAVEKIRTSVKPHLPIAIMAKELSENLFIESDSPLGGIMSEPISVPAGTALELILKLATYEAQDEHLCYVVDEDVIIVSTRTANLLRYYYNNPAKKTKFDSGLSSEIHAILNKKIDLSGLGTNPTFKQVIDIISKAEGTVLKFDVKWEDLLEDASIQPDTPVGISGLDTIQSISLDSALRLILFSVSTCSLAEINYVIDKDTLIIATNDYFENESSNMDASDTEQ